MTESVTEPGRILPRPTAVSEPYWQGCAEGELRLQRCADCGRHQFYPRIFCSHCGGQDLAWEAVAGTGRIASYTVVRRGVSRAYEAPYVIALIDLDVGVRLMSQIAVSDPDDQRLNVGAAVTVTFAKWSAEVTVPLFELTQERLAPSQ
ncbi:MAG: Zn-ribbon domain-containing OB-fold protein [Pseudomonadota bacterium]